MSITITIHLKEESGKILERLIIDESTIEKIILKANKLNLKCFSFIDLYSDTIFNNLQIKEMMKECPVLKKEFKEKNILVNLDKIKKLLEKGSRLLHSHIIFVGN